MINIWNSILEYAYETNAGIFVILFIGLLVTSIWFVRWVIQQSINREEDLKSYNREREEKYIKVIETQAEGLKTVELVKDRLEIVQGDVRDIRRAIDSVK